MKKFIFLILNIVVVITSITAQEADSKSKIILDELSLKVKTYTSLKIDFSYIIKNKTEKIDETIKGNILLNKDKYRLELPEQLVLCDGKSVYTVLKGVNEVHITGIEESTDAITPHNIFTIYQKGHKSKLIREGEENEKKVYVIELLPNEAKEYYKVRLNVETTTKMLLSAVAFFRNGTTITYELSKVQPNIPVTDDKFIFNAVTYSKYEIIDLR